MKINAVKHADSQLIQSGNCNKTENINVKKN